jgi:hypothetical protein
MPRGATPLAMLRRKSEKEIRELSDLLAILWDNISRQGPSYEENKISQHLTELYEREEIMWRQHSRVQWLAEGDKNTCFFHLRASQIKKINRITRLTRPNGGVTQDDQEMADLTSTFYEDLYISEGVTNMGEVINVIPVKVTEQMNMDLLKPFEEHEFKTALFQMFPTKAPGPDGFPTHFF